MKHQFRIHEVVALSFLAAMIPGALVISLLAQLVGVHFGLLGFLTPFIFMLNYYHCRRRGKAGWIDHLYRWMSRGTIAAPTAREGERIGVEIVVGAEKPPVGFETIYKWISSEVPFSFKSATMLRKKKPYRFYHYRTELESLLGLTEKLQKLYESTYTGQLDRADDKDLKEFESKLGGLDAILRSADARSRINLKRILKIQEQLSALTGQYAEEINFTKGRDDKSNKERHESDSGSH